MHQVREVREAARAVTSLDQPVGEDEGTTLGELFASEAAEPVEEVSARCASRSCSAPCPSCPRREREILRRRYGLTDEGRPQSVEQVVRSLGVSRAEVREMEHCALERLAARARWKPCSEVA